MSNVERLLENKGREVWSIRPDESVFNAIKLMDEKCIGALAVIQHDILVGIISERDYARKVILKGRSSKDTHVEEIMTRQILYTFPEQNIEQCMKVMTENNIRHLPVIDNSQIVGMISLGDIVKEIIADQQFRIQRLEHYLTWEESY